MLRTCLLMAILAILCAVRSADAVNCTSTSFKQDLDATKLAASQIIAEDYATKTKEQIIAKLMEEFKDTVISFDYTVTQKGDTTTIEYKIISACNETTTTTLPDGTKKTTEVTSKVDKAQVQKTVSAGLYNEICFFIQTSVSFFSSGRSS